MKLPTAVFSTRHCLRLLAFSSLICVSFFATPGLMAQSITTIYTDYNGYYRSADTAINPAKTTKSNNLLAFLYKGVVYSTGVSDSTLAANSVSKVSGRFKSLPVASIGGSIGAGSSTYVLLPAADDGVPNGTVTPYPALGISAALTDGKNGLNIGSGVTNLPATASLTFPVTTIDASAITDSTPDIVYTQIAATGGAPDTLYFINSSAARVGNSVIVRWASVPAVGNHSCDLYSLSAGTCDNAAINGVNASAQDKEYRLVAFRLSEFGITAANALGVAKLIIRPGGSSDPAFVAYNVDAFTVLTVLPMKFINLGVTKQNEKATLSWQTAAEENSHHFEIERSRDGRSFITAGFCAAAGYSTTVKSYGFSEVLPEGGKYYYRIKGVDKNGKAQWSDVISVTIGANGSAINAFPNPAKGSVTVQYPLATGREELRLIDMAGRVVWHSVLATGSRQKQINLEGMAKGSYRLVLSKSGTSLPAYALLITSE